MSFIAQCRHGMCDIQANNPFMFTGLDSNDRSSHKTYKMFNGAELVDHSWFWQPFGRSTHWACPDIELVIIYIPFIHCLLTRAVQKSFFVSHTKGRFRMSSATTTFKKLLQLTSHPPLECRRTFHNRIIFPVKLEKLWRRLTIHN